MIHPEDFERKLGFDQVRDRILEYCLGIPGRQHAAAMSFRTGSEEIKVLLQQNLEVKKLIDRGTDLGIHAYYDPTPWFETATTEGGYLEGEDFLRLLSAINIIQVSKAFLTQNKENCPTLFMLTEGVSDGKGIPGMIRSAIDEEGKLKDSASGTLQRIRKELREQERKVRKVAEQIMQQALNQSWAPGGSQPTIRDGRLVIPVTSEHKRKIKGYIIDQSATGQTVFVEPGELVEANNDLREMELEERKEVIRILREMTSTLRQYLPEFERDFAFLGMLDFVRAKAKYALEIQADMPQVKTTPAMQWMDARHPLLMASLKGKRPLVPLTIDLADKDRFLLVSGPNAGGKSVCLKTVGLLQYMLQCGLLVPLHPDSTMGIFHDIFLDMGDQQSIENDLSTYSSHLRNMDLFIRRSGSETLVLLDELGAGTDPNFGGGIAQAVLHQLINRKVWGLATTHYYNLKVFASNTEGIRNAAMLFDTELLIPLFKLEIGQPGSSFALEIARKTGLSDETIGTAEQIIGKGLTGLETLMKELTEDKQALEQQERKVRQQEEQLSATLRQYEELSGTLESQKKEILNKAKHEASAILEETNREIEKTIRHIRENKAEKKETKKVRQDLKELQNRVKPASTVAIKQAPLSVGDKVRITGGDVTGTILSLKGKKASVQFGDVRSSVTVDRLVRSDRVQVSSKQAVRGVELHQRQSEFSPQLDVRGKRVEELLPLLMRFMDDAVLLGEASVRILHGKGEGVLRKVVREYLGKLKTVASFRDEHADRGGDGVTIVELR